MVGISVVFSNLCGWILWFYAIDVSCLTAGLPCCQPLPETAVEMGEYTELSCSTYMAQVTKEQMGTPKPLLLPRNSLVGRKEIIP